MFLIKGCAPIRYNSHFEDISFTVKDFKKEYQLNTAKAFDDLGLFVESLNTPRKIMLMVSAGLAIDHIVEDLIPLWTSIFRPPRLIMRTGQTRRIMKLCSLFSIFLSWLIFLVNCLESCANIAKLLKFSKFLLYTLYRT